MVRNRFKEQNKDARKNRVTAFGEKHDLPQNAGRNGRKKDKEMQRAKQKQADGHGSPRRYVTDSAEKNERGFSEAESRRYFFFNRAGKTEEKGGDIIDFRF